MIETYDIRISVSGQSSLRGATKSALGFESAMKGVHHSNLQARDSLGRFIKRSDGLGGVTSKVNGLLGRLGAVATVYDSLNKSAQMEGFSNAIDFATAGEGAKNLEFISQASEALGQSLESNLKGFKLWAGATKGTILQGQATRDIFYAVSEASTVLNMSANDTEGVLLALSQMMSKGKVSAEELRGQLGERLSGAFNLAAKSMGITDVELNKMLETGKIMSSDFLPRFAQELHSTFGGSVAKQSRSATANFNRMQNALYRLRVTLGQNLMPIATSLINNYLIPAADWTGRNMQTILGYAAAVGLGYTALKVYTVTTKLATAATALFRGGFAALNVVMALNPVGLVVTGLVALGAGVVYAWNKFAGFRGFLVGMWGAIRETGSILYKNAIKPLIAVGKVLTGVFTLNVGMIKQGIQDGFEALQDSDSVAAAAAKIGAKYAQGFQEGSAMGKAKLPGFKAPDALSKQFSNIPGMQGAGAGTNTSAPGTSVTNGINAINGGGKNTKILNVTIQKVVESFMVKTEQLGQSEQDIKAFIERVLVQSINSLNQLQ